MSDPRPEIRSDDPELGPLRRCPRCEEWWPDDEEFFYVSGGKRHSWCRACYLERKVGAYAAKRRGQAAA